MCFSSTDDTLAHIYALQKQEQFSPETDIKCDRVVLNFVHHENEERKKSEREKKVKWVRKYLKTQMHNRAGPKSTSKTPVKNNYYQATLFCVICAVFN